MSRNFPLPALASETSPEREHSAEHACQRAERLAQITGKMFINFLNYHFADSYTLGTDERCNHCSCSGSPVQSGPIPQPIFTHVDNIPQTQLPLGWDAPLRNPMPILPLANMVNMAMDIDDPFLVPGPATRVIDLNDSPPCGRLAGLQSQYVAPGATFSNIAPAGGLLAGHPTYLAHVQLLLWAGDIAHHQIQNVEQESNYPTCVKQINQSLHLWWHSFSTASRHL